MWLKILANICNGFRLWYLNFKSSRIILILSVWLSQGEILSLILSILNTFYLFIYFNIFIGVYFLYNGVLVSAL